MMDIITGEAIAALLQVVMIDLVLAGDNAVVIGLAAARLPPEQRRRAIIVGILAATVLRILFAGITTQLLQVLGLLLAGGILLLWVCWKMWRELRATSQEEQGAYEIPVDPDSRRKGAAAGRLGRKTFGQATLQIVVADASMSLDNVLAVAGAARDHPFVLRSAPIHCADGYRRRIAGSIAAETPLDQLCGASHHFLCGLRDDVSRRLRVQARDRRSRTGHSMIHIHAQPCPRWSKAA
jgi:YjbE family integral membrane protein